MTRNEVEIPSGVGDGVMLDVLQGFVHELRAAGLPVSMTENLDAMRGVEQIPLDRPRVVPRGARGDAGEELPAPARRSTPSSTSTSRCTPAGSTATARASGETGDMDEAGGVPGQQGSGGSGEGMSNEELAEMLMAALMNMDQEQLRQIAAMAVARFAGMEPGRPVGGTYYLYRTLRQLDYDALAGQAHGARRAAGPGRGRRGRARGVGPAGPLRPRGVRAPAASELRDMIEAEIRRRLVADRGVEAMARTLRKPLPEDIDFMHASREEMQQLQRAIEPLTRALAARLAQRRKRKNRGQLDFRSTVRHSLSYGGVPAEPKFKSPRPSKPEIMVVADISGSVASFARFTLQFVYAIAGQFSKVRSWVFIDGIDEVTRFFQESDELTEAIAPGEHGGGRRVGRRPLGLRPRVRGVPRAPPHRGHAEDDDHPARRRAEQLPRRAGARC